MALAGTNLEDQDAQLVEGVLAGERPAFEALYGRHAGRVIAYFLRSGFSGADADDLTQEVFLRVHRSLDTYDAARGAFRTWIGAIARNVARRHWSRNKAAESFDSQLAEEVFAAADNPHTSPQVREEIDALQQCVGELPQELAAMVKLRYVQGRTTRGIAGITGLPESTVRLRLRQAQEMLERCLRQKGVLD